MKSRYANFNKHSIVSFLRICLEAIINFERITPILQRQIYNEPELFYPNDGMIFRFKKITKVNETILYLTRIPGIRLRSSFKDRDTNENEKLLQREQYFLYAFSDRKLKRYVVFMLHLDEKEKVSSCLQFLERN